MVRRISFIASVILVFSAGANLCRGQDSTAVQNDTLATGNNSRGDNSDSTQIDRQKQLQQFRQAFDKVVNAKKIKQKKEVQQDPSLDLGVLVLDETRTKMGRDFYSLFYQNWQAPDSVSNFTITISEQPSPGIGSLVTIKIDYNPVYRARLQPRYTYIEAVSKQAVARCLQIIEQKEKVRQQLSGF